MTDQKIEPALSAEGWADARDESGALSENLLYEVCYLWGKKQPAATIALANAALPDDDPRKITRETVSQLRVLVGKAEDSWDEGPAGEGWQSDALIAAVAAGRKLVLALESYLPPEIET